MGDKKNSDFLDSPFRYPGHQIYTLDRLLALVPEHRSFIEPFCGGASEFFAKPKAEENWLNDIDPELIETYRVIRDKPQRLITFIKEQEESGRGYEYVATEFVPKDSFETAARWFYLNQTSSMESMSRFWIRDGNAKLRPRGWAKKIRACSEKLQGVKLTSGDFGNVINSAPEGAFLYITPPYSIHHTSAQNRLHKFPFEREDHLRLVEVLRRNAERLKFMLTYNENEELRSLYSWGNLEIIGIPNTPPQKGEIVIRNYR